MTRIKICGLRTSADIAAFSPYGIDLSSAAETNGVKDKNKMQKLVRSVHHE